MKLYMVPLAPNPTKVCLYLAERGANGSAPEVEQVVVNTLKGKHKEAAHVARNPFGTLPVLELDDGTYVRESLPIIEYFEDKYPDGALRADTPEAIAVARGSWPAAESIVVESFSEYCRTSRACSAARMQCLSVA